MHTDHPEPTGRLLSWPAVRERVGISRTTAWRLQKEGSFPRPVVISAGRVGWREEDITAWTAGLAARGASAPRPVGRPPIVPRPPAVSERPPDPPVLRMRSRSRAPKPPNPQLGFDF